jgi:hypothetical protein
LHHGKSSNYTQGSANRRTIPFSNLTKGGFSQNSQDLAMLSQKPSIASAFRHSDYAEIDDSLYLPSATLTQISPERLFSTFDLPRSLSELRSLGLSGPDNQASHDATVQVAGLSGDMSATGALTPLAQAPIKIMTTDSQSLSTGATSMSSTAAVEGIAHSASGTVVVKLGTTASQ